MSHSLTYDRLLVAVFSLIMLGSVARPGHASVIPDTQIQLGPGDSFSDYTLTVIQDPPTLDFTGVGLLLVGGGIQISWFHVDEGSSWYLAAAGQAFTPRSIDRGEVQLLHGIYRPPYEIPDPTSFYLAVATEHGFEPNGPNRDIFGWAEFRLADGTLEILRSAVAYEEGGIIVGTLTAIPEPGTALLVMLGLAALASARDMNPHV